jgi:polyisoprenoid-binding protein YceI
MRGMSRRLRRWLALAVVLVVAVLGGAFAFFFLLGDDAPPPPSLSDEAAATATPEATATPQADASYTVSQSDGTFVGYRVREEFVGFGVKDAVGRTPDVSGSVGVEGDQITQAELQAELSTLVSDEGRRDNALRSRAIETDRFPTAEFTLSGPVAISKSKTTAAGELTLHGQTQKIEVTLRSQRIDSGIELVGSAPIAFADFDIEPPSIAGFVTVEDHGTLEFKLRLRPVAA